MGTEADLHNKWEAFLNLAKVRELRFYNHIKLGRPKEMTKYNLVVFAKNAEDLKEMEVGLKVYHDKIEEFTSTIFGSSKGIKTELATEEDWNASGPKEAAATTPEMLSIASGIPLSGDQNELLKMLETTIRQKVEAELREALKQEQSDPAKMTQIVQQAREELQEEEQNRRLAVRLTMISDGDQALSALVMAWQQAKQSGDGGQPWSEVKQRLLEMFDTTIQLIQS